MLNSKQETDLPSGKLSNAIRRSLFTIGLVLGLASVVYLLWVATFARSGPQPPHKAESTHLASTLQHNPVSTETKIEASHHHPTKTALAMPQTPVDFLEVKETAFRQAVQNHVPHPAEVALRKSISHYISYNRQFADAQAQAEGISVEEVEELTYFGFLAQATQQWGEVEALLDQAVSEDVRLEASRWLDDLNDTFTDTMRTMVNNGATEPERWRFIRETQQRYLDKYFEITAMNNSLLQDLLAGDINRVFPVTDKIAPELSAQQNMNYPSPTPSPL